jgi:hypothetical protein
MMIKIWLRIWGDYNYVFIDGVHICTQPIDWSSHLKIEIFNFGGFIERISYMVI